MPGTYARDALAPNLAAGIDWATVATDDGSIVEVNKPAKARVRLKTGTVSSTGNSATLSVEIKASNDSTFSTGVVSLGRFAALSGTDAAQSNVTRYLDVRIDKRYVRATAVIGGTASNYGSVVLELDEENFRRLNTDSA